MTATARRALLWITVALAGVILAVALAFAMNHIVVTHVGLAGEPPSAGTTLSPPPRTQKATRPAPTQPTTTSTADDDQGETDDD